MAVVAIKILCFIVLIFISAIFLAQIWQFLPTLTTQVWQFLPIILMIVVFIALVKLCQFGVISTRVKKLKNQQFLAIKNKNHSIFIPSDKYSNQFVRIDGSIIDLAEEKIEDCSYPVKELLILDEKKLYSRYRTHEDEDVDYIAKGIKLLHKMIKIRENKILPIAKKYQQMACNCRRDSEEMLNEGRVADSEDFKQYRNELYDKEKRLMQIEASEWQNIVKDIYKAIKTDSSWFTMSLFPDIETKIEDLESFIQECEINQKIYSSLAYKTVYK
ncbi:MAG: hypothetical protein AAF757_16945 [Cyanobacteria bacterium P01_D01_bin.116]